MNYRDIVRPQLRVDEGVRTRPYKDTVGKTTIGVGRNLDDKGLRPKEIDFMLENDIDEAEADAKSLFKNFDFLSPNRQAVVVNMCFNLGKTRLSGFQNFISAVGRGDWKQAAKEMLDSLWAKQVGDRAQRLANLMEQG